MISEKITKIGIPPWDEKEIAQSINEFSALYAQRPIKINEGGMKSPHMFATWFMLKKIDPKFIVESGIWRGQGTWLIENAVPNAKIISLDINLSYREYVSDKVVYYEKDFSKVDWNFIKVKEETVLFFDDHQNAFNRVMQAKKFGFKHMIFEDNYPATQGDCYSLKKAFLGCGFNNTISQKWSIIGKLKNKIIGQLGLVKPNFTDSAQLKRILETYYEFPPVFKKSLTRWNDLWDDTNYPTPQPLFSNYEPDPDLNILYEEAKFYTWICYAKIK